MTPAQKLAELRAALDTSDTLECVESLHDDSGSTVEYMHLREVGSKAFHSSPLGMYPPMAELAAFAANNAPAIAQRERELEEELDDYKKAADAEARAGDEAREQLAARDAEIAKLRAALEEIYSGPGCACEEPQPKDDEHHPCCQWKNWHIAAEALKQSEANDER